MLCKIGVPEDIAKYIQKNLRWSVKHAGLQPATLLKETPAQLFSGEFYKIRTLLPYVKPFVLIY